MYTHRSFSQQQQPPLAPISSNRAGYHSPNLAANTTSFQEPQSPLKSRNTNKEGIRGRRGNSPYRTSYGDRARSRSRTASRKKNPAAGRSKSTSTAVDRQNPPPPPSSESTANHSRSNQRRSHSKNDGNSRHAHWQSVFNGNNQLQQQHSPPATPTTHAVTSPGYSTPLTVRVQDRSNHSFSNSDEQVSHHGMYIECSRVRLFVCVCDLAKFNMTECSQLKMILINLKGLFTREKIF